MRPILPACALLAFLAVPAWAGEDDPPAPPPKPAEEQPAPKAVPAPPVPPTPPGGMTRKDIEELVRRGGRLPEGFRPHGMRAGEQPTGALHREPPFGLPGMGDAAMQGALAKAMGRLILTYLAEKDDPARGPVWEELLGSIATVLADEQGLADDGGGPRTHLPRLMAIVMRGMQDPATRPVYSKVMQLLGTTMGPMLLGGATRPDPSPPEPGPHVGAPAPVPPPTPGAAWPRTFAGAPIAFVIEGRTVDAVRILLREVPAGSLADRVGLEAGDVILALDGREPTPARLRAAAGAIVPGGKLRLRLQRREGDIETLDLEFEAGDE